MAIELKKVTQANQTLKVIASSDTAIDWDAMEDKEAPEGRAEHLPELTPTECKKAAYMDGHDTASLKFKDGDKPTLFIFKHPHRQDVATSMRSLYSKIYNPMNNKNLGVELFKEVFDGAFIGTEDGFDGPLSQVPRDKTRKISADYLQALNDADVFDELALSFIDCANAKKKKDPDSIKK